VDASVDAEPGLPGTALARFTLAIRFGDQPPFPLTMWFPATCRPFLQHLVAEIRAAPVVTTRSVPADQDWVVFRPAVEGGDQP
jgi:hypothetical protein